MKKQLFRISIGLFTLGVIFLTGCSKNEDTTAPSITLSGDQTMTISLNSSYSEPGYSASDDEDGTITNSVSVSGSVNPNLKGVYTISYSVSDKAGNSTTVNRTVNVVNDAEIFAGAYNNCSDTCTLDTTAYNATLITSDTINNLVKINNFGGFGSTQNIWIKFNNGLTTGSLITLDNNQSIGTAGGFIANVFSSECIVISGSAPTSFTLKYAWNDGAGGSETCRAFYLR